MSRARYKPPLGWQDTACWGALLAAIYVLLAAAMFGFSLVCLQVVLAGRFKTVDRPFGLDVLMRFHKAMGVGGALALEPPAAAGLGPSKLAAFVL